MKLGAENRTKLALACGLFVIAVLLLARLFAGGGQPAAAAVPAQPTIEVPPAVRGGRTARLRSRPGTEADKAAQSDAISLDPRLRLDLLKLSEDTDYKGSGRNIFRAEADIPKPIVSPVVKPAIPAPVVYTPPPPPPINLKFFGFASSAEEPARVFLAQGDNIFVAAEGEIVNRRYKVLRINPKSVEIEDVLSNNRQTILLTAG